jgi:hypothetical protein
MTGLITRILVVALGLWLAAHIAPGVEVRGLKLRAAVRR